VRLPARPCAEGARRERRRDDPHEAVHPSTRMLAARRRTLPQAADRSGRAEAAVPRPTRLGARRSRPERRRDGPHEAVHPSIRTLAARRRILPQAADRSGRAEAAVPRPTLLGARRSRPLACQGGRHEAAVRPLARPCAEGARRERLGEPVVRRYGFAPTGRLGGGPLGRTMGERLGAPPARLSVYCAPVARKVVRGVSFIDPAPFLSLYSREECAAFGAFLHCTISRGSLRMRRALHFTLRISCDNIQLI